MSITLASDSLSDASVTDGIGRGDLGAAARLWVRHWPTALASARLYVDRPEVPGLAAEALIGTISMTALGRGPREDVAGFVAGAVRELGEDDEPPPIDVGELAEIYTSSRMTRSFAALPASAQEELRHPDSVGDHAGHALTVLQTSYLTTHLDEAPSRECKPTHIALMSAAEGRRTDGFAADNWLHMSTCAWCTEAFHELAFSNTALPALIAPDIFVADVELPLVPLEVEVAEPVLAAVAEEEAEEEAEPVTPHRAGVHAVLRGSRNRILAAAAFTAAVAVLGVVISQNLSGNDDGTSPSAVTNAQPTPEPTATDGTDAHGFGGTLESPGALPTASVAGPLEIASPSATPKAEKSATPKPKPTKTPSPTPSAPGTSASADPDPDPTPTPSASPTPACNPLQHLLGFC